MSHILVQRERGGLSFLRKEWGWNTHEIGAQMKILPVLLLRGTLLPGTRVGPENFSQKMLVKVHETEAGDPGACLLQMLCNSLAPQE